MLVIKNFLNCKQVVFAIRFMLKERMFFVLGSSGYVGSKIFHFLTKNERDVIGISRSEIDYTNPKILKEFLRSKKPRFLINAAGYTGKPNVDACELAKAFRWKCRIARGYSSSMRRIKDHMGPCL